MKHPSKMDAIRGLKPMPASQQDNYSITDLLVGGYLNIQGENWLVLGKARYVEVKWSNFKPKSSEDTTFELTILSLKTGEIKYIEYYVDDDVEIFITDKEVKLSELGLSRSELEYISDEEEGSVRFDGHTFDYSDNETMAALYFRDELSEGIPVRFYEFEAQNGLCLTAEAWYDDVHDERPDREAFISREVSSSDITILQLSK